MLRLLIWTGVLLMVVGFGAAGWQYWQGLSPAADATAPDPAAPEGNTPPAQGWLISATGGLVAEADVRAFLVQDRLVPDRMVTLTLTAPLTDLLTQGEALPAEAFLPVFADIRAPQIARPLCPVLTEGIAAACAVQSARLIEGGVDPARGTARFRIELAYRLKPDLPDLPDLAQHVLTIDRLPPPLAEGEAASPETAPPESAATAAAALATALTAATAPCTGEDRALGCRLLRLSLDWAPGAPVTWTAELGWLQPLPRGMIPVAPIAPLPAEG